MFSELRSRLLTLCVLMDFPIHIKAIRMGLSIMYLKGPQIVISQLLSNSIPEDCFTLTNSVDLDEMQHDVAFHLGLHSLSKYLFMGFQYTKPVTHW